MAGECLSCKSMKHESAMGFWNFYKGLDMESATGLMMSSGAAGHIIPFKSRLVCNWQWPRHCSATSYHCAILWLFYSLHSGFEYL